MGDFDDDPEIRPQFHTFVDDPVTESELDPLRQIVVDGLSKAGWGWGCVSAIDSNGRTIWIADAHRGDGKRFVVHAEEKLTAFMELEAAIYEFAVDAISTNR